MNPSPLAMLWQRERDGIAEMIIRDASIYGDSAAFAMVEDAIAGGASIEACIQGLRKSQVTPHSLIAFLECLLSDGHITKEQFATYMDAQMGGES